MEELVLIYFSSIAGVSTLNVALTETIKRNCNITKAWVVQLISWCLPIILCMFGFGFQIGVFANFGAITDWYGWVYSLITGVGLGLVSNGEYDITFVQKILDLFAKLFKKKSTVTETKTTETTVTEK